MPSIARQNDKRCQDNMAILPTKTHKAVASDNVHESESMLSNCTIHLHRVEEETTIAGGSNASDSYTTTCLTCALTAITTVDQFSP